MARAAASQVKSAARSGPRRAGQLAERLVVVRPFDRRGDGARVERVGEEARVADHLRQRRRGGRDDGDPLGHRLEGGEAESLVEARVGEEPGAPEELRPRARRDPPEAGDPGRVPRPRQPLLEAGHSPARSAGDHEVGEFRAAVPDRLHRRDEPLVVLPGLEGPDGEDVRPGGRRPGTRRGRRGRGRSGRRTPCRPPPGRRGGGRPASPGKRRRGGRPASRWRGGAVRTRRRSSGRATRGRGAGSGRGWSRPPEAEQARGRMPSGPWKRSAPALTASTAATVWSQTVPGRRGRPGGRTSTRPSSAAGREIGRGERRTTESPGKSRVKAP